MSDQLPYTYTDRDGDSITVNLSRNIQVVETFNGKAHRATVYAPKGEDTVALTRAILAAAGDTGHEVISIEDYARAWAAVIEAAARSMRERATEWLVDNDFAWEAEQVRALPLLPDDTEGVRTMRHCVLCASGDHQPSDHDDDTPVYESPQELAQEIERLTAERDRLRTAWGSARRRARQQCDALREGLIADRDRARRARDRYRDERNTARAGLADARRWGRILEAQRADLRRKLADEESRVAALRIAYQAAKDADLPEEDMVEPGDEVPALTELRELVERLALGQAETTKVVTKRLAVVETHLGITDDTPEELARYRDATGDLWEERSDGLLTTIAVDPDRPRDLGITLTRAIAERQYGPLTPVTDTAPLPRRDDHVAAWLKTHRDAAAVYSAEYNAVDGLLDLYRLHADTGTRLDQHACETRCCEECAAGGAR